MLNLYDHVLEFVDDYLHEALTPGDAAYVERHCEACRICKIALEEARKRLALVESVPASEASEALIRATLDKVAAHDRQRTRLRKRLAWTLLPALAASVLITGVLHLYYLNLSATPYDLRLLGQTVLLTGTTASIRVELLDHGRGTALAGVPVAIELRNRAGDPPVPLAHFVTNAQGSGQPRFQLPDWPDGTYELRVTAQPPGGPEVLTEPVQLKRSWKLMLTSDKPVYQPGQTIHVRSLALRRPDLKPVAGQEVTFAITDPRGNIIFKRQDVTSRYGIASLDCPLASEILEGAYAIACKIGQTESKTTVEVKKYVLPKFKLGVELDQPYYQPGQTVHGKVHADYFFGKPVADGRVEIDIQTSDLDPKIARTLEARTDPKGDASFDFALPAGLIWWTGEYSGDKRIPLQVTVHDTAGQKQTRSVSCLVTANPLRVEVIPEGGSLVEGVSNRIYLYTSYPDGKPARARLAISGHEQEIITNGLGVASFDLTPGWTGAELTIKATDSKGRVGRRHVQLACGQAASDFLIRTDKAVYNGGDTLRLIALGGGSEPVFVDFIKDGQTLLTETVEMTNGRGRLQFDLPPDLFGTVELCAYRFNAAGQAVRKSRVLYVRQAGQLQIQAALDRAEYRPGKRARLQLRLTDDHGKPSPGALSLTAVDEAVYSVLDEAPGMERTFYLLEQELLAPVYAIYPWVPDLKASTSPAERNQFEQALFARTSQTDAGSPPPAKGSTQSGGTARSWHALTVSSLPDKIQATERARQTGLGRVEVAWLVLGGVLLLLAYVALWVFAPRGVVFAAHGLGLLFGMAYFGMRERSATLGLPSDRPLAFQWASPAAEPDDIAIAGGGPKHRAEHKKNAIAAHADGSVRFGTGVEIEIIDGTSSMLAVAEAPGSTQREAPVRVREWFPETVLWRPELITDDQGRASLDIDLADSITTWRLLASAIDAGGRLGATSTPVRVFQPFFVDLNLPVTLTRGDEAAIPVVVYNYLDKPQTVALTLANTPGFERLADAAKHVELAANEVRSVSYRLRATRVGQQHLRITARGSGVADALQRDIEVVPDGRRVEQVFNGALQRPAEIRLAIPQEAIEGSPKAILKIYPSSFSQLVEGLDAIFQMPYGCFEQTSSMTYPNVLALDYLRRTKQAVPAVEAKARQYIHLGYQRLLSFEVPGGVFDWFGNPPANCTLTAYGLMEFEDMARVHDVDPNLIERTRRWLLSKRNPDGSWAPESHRLHDDPTHAGATDDLGRLSTTAYVAWAVFRDPAARSQAGKTLDYLLGHRPDTIEDAHVLALVSNALVAMQAEPRDVASYLDRLEALKRASDDGKLAWWEPPAGTRTLFYGAGHCGSIETTALAALVLLHAGQHPGTAGAALAWLTRQKDASGTWYSTQATVLTLQALLAGTGKPLGGNQERRITFTWDGGAGSVLAVPADQADVVQQLDLSNRLSPGEHRLTLAEDGDLGTVYQVAFRYHVPGAGRPQQPGPLTITLTYDRSELAVGDVVTATATVLNQTAQPAPMVLLDLPIPAGFAAEELADLTRSGQVARYQVTPRRVLVYLRGLQPGKPLTLRYRLRATMPVRVTVPAARAYEYYDTDRQGSSLPAHLTVRERRAVRG